jgi:uncharacterized damage-inducible protein DinB
MHSPPSLSSDIRLLLTLLDQAYDRRSWHGTNLRGSIRGVTARQAARRPGAGRHNIWELVVHAAYWKYAVRRRLAGEARGSFPVTGSNWFARPTRVRDRDVAWKADVALLAQMHRSLRAVVAGLPFAQLRRPAAGGNETVLALVTGIAAHDVYHAGQIQLIKRLSTR